MKIRVGINETITEKSLRKSIKLKDTWISNKYMKEFSTLLVIRKIQIKTTVRYNYIAIRKCQFKKTKHKCLQGYGATKFSYTTDGNVV